MSSSVPGVWSVEVVEAETRAVWLVSQCKERPAPELVGRWVAYVSPPGGGARLRAGETREELVDAVVSACRGALSVRVPSSLVDAVSRALGSATEVVADASLDLAAAARAALVRVEASSQAGEARDLGAEPGALTSLARSLELYDRGLAPWSMRPGQIPLIVAIENERHLPECSVSMFAGPGGHRIVQVLPRYRPSAAGSPVSGDPARAVVEWCEACGDDYRLPLADGRGLGMKAYVRGGYARLRALLGCEVRWLHRVVDALGVIADEVLDEIERIEALPSSRRGGRSDLH